MGFLGEVLGDAISYVVEFGPELRSILSLTLVVAGLATLLGVVIGVPCGIWLGLGRFRGRGVLLALVNTGMGIPPVLAGLLLLILLWNDGVLGSWDALFTPGAMVAAQALLAFPIAAGVTAGAVRNLSGDAREKTQALKEIDRLTKTLAELKTYEDDILYPLATERLEIDLDDGVKVNYPKFGRALKTVRGLS